MSIIISFQWCFSVSCLEAPSRYYGLCLSWSPRLSHHRLKHEWPLSSTNVNRPLSNPKGPEGASWATFKRTDLHRHIWRQIMIGLECQVWIALLRRLNWAWSAWHLSKGIMRSFPIISMLIHEHWNPKPNMDNVGRTCWGSCGSSSCEG